MTQKPLLMTPQAELVATYWLWFDAQTDFDIVLAELRSMTEYWEPVYGMGVWEFH